MLMCVHVCVYICVGIWVFHKTFGLQKGLHTQKQLAEALGCYESACKEDRQGLLDGCQHSVASSDGCPGKCMSVIMSVYVCALYTHM